MEAISYTKARSQLCGVMQRVCDDHDPIIVTRQKSPSVVIMSLEDYNALAETAYLLQSPKNAARLHQSIEAFRNNQTFEKIDI